MLRIRNKTGVAEPHNKSFYRLHGALDGKACQGTACFAARHLNPARWEQAAAQTERLYCLGQCYMSPAIAGEDARPHMAVHARQPILLERVLNGGARRIETYREQGGYRALEMALRTSPDQVVSIIEASGIRGRGGAGFPTGRKWRAVLSQPARPKYVVSNADEGDPGAYIDRFLLEDDPHCQIEGMIIAGYAVGANEGYIYLRKEYPQAEASLRQALAEAEEAGWLGDHVGGTDFKFRLKIVMGHGAYICGEETALLNSIEGRRAEVRARPPYPTEQGLWNQPTLVNNVETLANIPWILTHGAEAYRQLGFSKSQGTKLISLNSLFNRPGLYEIEFGMTLREIVETLGGGLKTGTLKGIIIGGPLAGIVPPSTFDTRFGFEELRAVGAMVGHGGIVAFDERTSIRELIEHIFSFGAYESCGKCTPCREGGRRIEEIFARMASEGPATAPQRAEWTDINAALMATSLCGHGTGMAEFARSASRYYPTEVEACFR